MQARLAIEMGRNRLQHLRESAPGAGDGLLPAGMCMVSVILIGLATAVALFAAWAKMGHSAERQTPAIHTPPATERSGAEAPSRITPSDGGAVANAGAGGPARQEGGVAVRPR
jgi:hypothetical protein